MNVPGELIPIVAIIAGASIAIFMPMARAMAKRMERESINSTGSSDVIERLERMEHAIESIAIEIERVSEGQRFTTRLLSETKAAQLPARAEER